MMTLFHEVIRKGIEVYLKDMISKSKNEDDHLDHLRKFFARLQKFQLRLNPIKCTFRVCFGKLLGFILSQWGIKVDLNKVWTIQDMPAPRIEK